MPFRLLSLFGRSSCKDGSDLGSIIEKKDAKYKQEYQLRRHSALSQAKVEAALASARHKELHHRNHSFQPHHAIYVEPPL